jgi:hypothetical protein
VRAVVSLILFCDAAVCNWPDPDEPIDVKHVRYWGTSGRAHKAGETILMTRTCPAAS